MEKGMIWYNSGNTMEINKASFYSTVALYLLSKLKKHLQEHTQYLRCAMTLGKPVPAG